MSNIHGGGSSTNKNGLGYENEVSIPVVFENYGHTQHLDKFHGKHEFMKFMKTVHGVDCMKIWSKKLLPDEALFLDNTVYIIEIKYQKVSGSVDEKLMTCDFRKKQYEKVCKAAGLKVVMIYILNDWFRDVRYKDCLDYIEESGCHYFFNEVPLSIFGLK